MGVDNAASKYSADQRHGCGIIPGICEDDIKTVGAFQWQAVPRCEQLWEVLKQVWEDYESDKIAPAFVHHAQVAVSIYECKGGTKDSALAYGDYTGHTTAKMTWARRTI